MPRGIYAQPASQILKPPSSSDGFFIALIFFTRGFTGAKFVLASSDRPSNVDMHSDLNFRIRRPWYTSHISLPRLVHDRTNSKSDRKFKNYKTDGCPRVSKMTAGWLIAHAVGVGKTFGSRKKLATIATRSSLALALCAYQSDQSCSKHKPSDNSSIWRSGSS